MAKYRINVTEILEDGTEQQLFNGPEQLEKLCDGFVIITRIRDEGANVILHGLSFAELAAIIEVSKPLKSAAKLAELLGNPRVLLVPTGEEAEPDAAD